MAQALTSMGRHKKKSKDAESEADTKAAGERALAKAPAPTTPRKLLLDDDSESDDTGKQADLRINKKFAKQYLEQKKIQELAECMTLV